MTSLSRLLIPDLSLVRTLPRPARVGLLLFFVAGLADGVLMPFFALWAQQEAKVPTEYIGLLLGCYAGGELLATPLLGSIADRLGRRPVLLTSTAGVGLGFLLLYLTHGVWAAACALIVIGVFECVLHPTAATVIADVVPRQSLRTHFALTRVMGSAGRVLGPAIGSVLVLWSLGLVFVCAALAMLIGLTATALFLPETLQPNSSSAEDEDEESITALAAAFRDSRLAGLLLPLVFLELSASWVGAVLPLYANDAGSLSPSSIGLLFTYAAIVGVVLQLPLTQASARISAFAIVLSSGVALALAFGILLWTVSVPGLVAGVTLLALARMLFGPLSQALVTELAPARARATYMAAFSVVGDLKDTAGPAIGTYLYAIAAGLPWLVGAPIALLSALALAVAARRHEAKQRDSQCDQPE